VNGRLIRAIDAGLQHLTCGRTTAELRVAASVLLAAVALVWWN
jgi:hypothetical protein